MSVFDMTRKTLSFSSALYRRKKATTTIPPKPRGVLTRDAISKREPIKAFQLLGESHI